MLPCLRTPTLGIVLDQQPGPGNKFLSFREETQLLALLEEDIFKTFPRVHNDI